MSKYRDRRRETALRLNDTRDNLLRVSDIVQEMDKQLLHLGAQAEVARQYRELESRRDTTQHLFWLVKKQEAAVARADYLRGIGQIRTELEARTAALREIETRLETSRSGHYQLSDALHARQGELYSANAEIARLEQQIKHAAAQQQRLQLQISNAKRQIEQQLQQRLTAIATRDHWMQQQDVAAEQLIEAEQNAQGQNLTQAEEAARSAQQRYHGLQREQLQLQQQLQLADAQLAGLNRTLSQLEARRSRLLLEKDNLPLHDNAALQQVQEELVELEMARAEHEENLDRLQEQLPQADSLRQQLRAALYQQERQLAQAGARLHALLQLQRQLDNDKNLTGWLQQHKLDGLPRLWQSIRIASGWENALEATLRERLNALALPELATVTGWGDAPPSRLALYADEAGRDSSRHERHVGMNPDLHPLLAYVECQNDQLIPAMHEWLESFYVVADLAQGYAQREQLPSGGWFVTPDGHLIGRYSVLFYAPDSLHGVLSRQREIEQLEHDTDEQKRGVACSQQQLTEAEHAHRALEVQIPPLRSAVSQSQQRQHALQMQLLKLNQAHERSAERSLQIAHEMQEAAGLLEIEQAQHDEIIALMANRREELAAFHAQLDEAQHQADEQEKALREQRTRAQQSQHALQEAHFFCRTCAEKIADMHDSIQQIMAQLIQSEENLAQLTGELLACEDDTATQQLQSALAVRQSAEMALSEARVNLENATAYLQELEQSRLSFEHQLTGLREQLSELTLKEQEARLHFEQWAEQLQGVDEQVLLPLLFNVKPHNLPNELNRLNRMLEALGAVNLAALDELQAATERKLYLDAQSLDLQQAMATLEEAIRRIDKESRDLLMATYHQVNQHLAELFPVLFAGGEARLVLTGEEILDSGVQVMAQPPGKKNSSIHLLSGGEKALTAIALIFSLFQLNPAPFCLLDEVDAPLDDTNTERLCALIRKMALHTQFVFISHNKITMELAQQLIGVTMQEKGVSK
ncbi:MAG: chromosome segregation protein SMC, partial [Gallionella sp.]|nr:chromosome segregation protein SMC [Gallionella sp.]